MKYSFFQRLRDLICLCALLFLIKMAYDRTYTFLSEHKNSIIHELDRSFMDQIYTAQRQLHILEQHTLYADTFASSIADIKIRLATIEEKYKKNSPGLALLGPIGSAAIVLKENKLQQQLLDTVNDMNKLIYTINELSHNFMPAHTIDIALSANKQLLRTLIA